MSAQTAQSDRPSFHVQGNIVFLKGSWRLRYLDRLDLHTVRSVAQADTTLDLTQLESIDTGSLALLLSELPSTQYKLRGESPEIKQIFELVSNQKIQTATLRDPCPGFLHRVGEFATHGWNEFKILLSFIGQTVVCVGQLFSSPKSLRVKELFVQIENTALNSVPVAALVMFLIGIVIAYLFAGQIEKYGANIFIVDGVSIAICRELSPVIVAIIVAGRSGSAFTAQLGTMKLNEEIDALFAMGLSVMKVLIVPRVLALMLALPILVALGDVIGIFGGLLVAKERLGIEPTTFMQRLHDVLKSKHVFVGLIKAPVFAAFIAIIGCKMGLTVENNARSIGLNTTSTVVQSIVSVILLNAGFAVLFMELGY